LQETSHVSFNALPATLCAWHGWVGRWARTSPTGEKGGKKDSNGLSELFKGKPEVFRGALLKTIQTGSEHGNGSEMQEFMSTMRATAAKERPGEVWLEVGGEVEHSMVMRETVYPGLEVLTTEQQGSVFEQIGRAIALVSFPSPKIRASDMPWLLSLHGRIFYRMMVSDADSTVQGETASATMAVEGIVGHLNDCLKLTEPEKRHGLLGELSDCLSPHLLDSLRESMDQIMANHVPGIEVDLQMDAEGQLAFMIFPPSAAVVPNKEVAECLGISRYPPKGFGVITPDAVYRGLTREASAEEASRVALSMVLGVDLKAKLTAVARASDPGELQSREGGASGAVPMGAGESEPEPAGRSEDAPGGAASRAGDGASGSGGEDGGSDADSDWGGKVAVRSVEVPLRAMFIKEPLVVDQAEEVMRRGVEHLPWRLAWLGSRAAVLPSGGRPMFQLSAD